MLRSTVFDDPEMDSDNHVLIADDATFIIPAVESAVHQTHCVKIPIKSEQDELKYQKTLFIMAIIFGAGAAVRQWAGAESFFDIFSSPSCALALGILSACAPWAFYYDNNYIFLKSSLSLFRKKHYVVYQTNIPSLPEPSVTHPLVSCYTLFQLLFGVCHTLATVGMVLTNFPAQLNWPGLVEVIFICLVVSNFCFGADKSKKFLDDTIGLFNALFFKKWHIAQAESNLLFILLEKYEHALQAIPENETHAATRGRLKDALVESDSWSKSIENITAYMASLQSKINGTEISGSDTNDFPPIIFAVRFNTTGCMPKSLTYSTSGFLNAVVLANAIYNIAGASGIASGLHTSIVGAYILCVIATASSLGLSKIYTDQWRENFLVWLEISEVIKSGPNKSFWNIVIPRIRSITIFHLLGYSLAVLQAMSGVYYSQQALEALSFLNRFGSVGKYFIEWFCLLSVGVVITAAKGGPTTYLLKFFWHKTVALCTCNKPHAESLAIQRIVIPEIIYLDDLINGLLHLLKLLIDQNPSLSITTMDESQDGMTFIEEIQQRVSDILGTIQNDSLVQRRVLCQYLLEQYTAAKTHDVVFRGRSLTDFFTPIEHVVYDRETNAQESAFCIDGPEQHLFPE